MRNAANTGGNVFLLEKRDCKIASLKYKLKLQKSSFACNAHHQNEDFKDWIA
jgi:hypothetical protein